MIFAANALRLHRDPSHHFFAVLDFAMILYRLPDHRLIRLVVWALDRGLSAAQTLEDPIKNSLPLLLLRKTPSISQPSHAYIRDATSESYNKDPSILLNQK
jgi:hypothetical protein